jgi:hypothetical protein
MAISRSASHCTGFVVHATTKVARRTSVIEKSCVKVPPGVRTVERWIFVFPCAISSAAPSSPSGPTR